MTKMSERMESKIKAHFDKLFSGVGPSQELYELKEELTFNLREKILDYTHAGMSEDKAFREAVISMGDLSGLVEDKHVPKNFLDRNYCLHFNYSFWINDDPHVASNGYAKCGNVWTIDFCSRRRSSINV